VVTFTWKRATVGCTGRTKPSDVKTLEQQMQIELKTTALTQNVAWRQLNVFLRFFGFACLFLNSLRKKARHDKVIRTTFFGTFDCLHLLCEGTGTRPPVDQTWRCVRSSPLAQVLPSQPLKQQPRNPRRPRFAILNQVAWTKRVTTGTTHTAATRSRTTAAIALGKFELLMSAHLGLVHSCHASVVYANSVSQEIANGYEIH